jgi:hypothetical protein
MCHRQRQAKVLAPAGVLRCNDVFFTITLPMPVRSRSRTAARAATFSTRRVALCASALLLGGAAAWNARAQNAPAAAPVVAAETPAPRENNLRMRLSSTQVQQAFSHIDRDGNGRLSRPEVSVYPRIERHFERIDADRDGNVSPQEFEVALQQSS